MLIDLTNVWKQQGDELYAACARAILRFSEYAAAEPQAPDVSKILNSVGAALSTVAGGGEADNVEVSVDAPGLQKPLSDLVCELASLTDFGIHQIARLLSCVSSDGALKGRDTASLASTIKNLDLRGYEEQADGSYADAVSGMRAIRSGIAALDFSGLGEAMEAVHGIDPMSATDEIVSAASERLFSEMRAAVGLSVDAIRATGARIRLVSDHDRHHYDVDVTGCIPQHWTVTMYLLGDHCADTHRRLEKLDILHALCGSDESIEKFAHDCASVGQVLPASKDGTYAAYLKKARDGFADFVAWYDAQPQAEIRCSVIKEISMQLCDHGGLTRGGFLGMSAEKWIQARRGAVKMKRKGLMVMVRDGAEAAASA
ncbi:hypothetical protein [Paracoccus sp. ME4]|uniref:hypothetical protein n=1 Tax=Paracoccus sp. ME4 TaxID=3138066 RepID=UPI00398AD4DE